MGQLQTYRSDCDNVLGEVNQALSHLDHLRERYVAVSTKTNALHEACEHLLAEQVYRLNLTFVAVNVLLPQERPHIDITMHFDHSLPVPIPPVTLVIILD